MRCHIIVSLESIECVESHRWPNKNAGAKLRECGRVEKTAQSPQPLRESY
jgi:hypothetical protein